MNVSKTEVGKVQYYLTLAVLIVALTSNAIGIGYTLRKVDEHDDKIRSLEREGSISAQLTARDIQWMREKLNTIERKIDRHMANRGDQ